MKKHPILALLVLLVVFLGSTSSKEIQVSKTKLLVTVIDESGNNVEGATITIYTSMDDYENNKNKLIIGKTDKKGKFQFKGLQNKPYFLDVRKDVMKNDGEGVQTGSLSTEKINRVIVVIK